MTDEKLLIDRAQRGDKEAFRELVERSKITTYRLAYDLTGNRHDAEDLSQEAYIRAYRGLTGFRTEAKWNSWLYRITMNTFYDHWRARSRRKLEYSDDLEQHNTMMTDSLQRTEESPEKKAEAGMIQKHIDHALQCLSPQERSVFVLRHYHDLPIKQIAETLEIAEGTVKSHLFRAIKRLQKELVFYRPELGLGEQS